MSPLYGILAHAGAGSSWQAMLVVAGIVLAGVLIAGGVGLVRIESGDDLVTPLATTAVAASLGLLGEAWFSDWIGWAAPLAAVALVALLLAAFTPLDVRFPAPLPMGAIALAGVAIFALYEPLTVALHPATEILPLRDDAEVHLLEPADGSTVDAGDVPVAVRIDGGSVAASEPSTTEVAGDPEEAGVLEVTRAEVTEGDVGTRERTPVTFAESCTVDAPCTEVSFDVALAPGAWELSVELLRRDGTPIAPAVRDRVLLDAS